MWLLRSSQRLWKLRCRVGGRPLQERLQVQRTTFHNLVGATFLPSLVLPRCASHPPDVVVLVTPDFAGVGTALTAQTRLLGL